MECLDVCWKTRRTSWRMISPFSVRLTFAPGKSTKTSTLASYCKRLSILGISRSRMGPWIAGVQCWWFDFPSIARRETSRCCTITLSMKEGPRLQINFGWSIPSCNVYNLSKSPRSSSINKLYIFITISYYSWLLVIRPSCRASTQPFILTSTEYSDSIHIPSNSFTRFCYSSRYNISSNG